MDFSIPAYLSDFSTQDDQRTIAKLKMFYVGETGDGRVFDKEFSDKLVKNGIAYLPVVAFYSDLKDDFIGHNNKQYIYGIVKPDAQNGFETDENGEEWFITEVMLYTDRIDNIGEVAKKIVGKQQSLEMDPNSVEYELFKENGKSKIRFTNARLVGLSVLGDDQKPAFSGSEFFTENEDLRERFENFFSFLTTKDRGANMDKEKFAQYVNFIKLTYDERRKAVCEYAQTQFGDNCIVSVPEMSDDYVILDIFNLEDWTDTYLKYDYKIDDQGVELSNERACYRRFLSVEEIEKLDEQVSKDFASQDQEPKNEGELKKKEDEPEVKEGDKKEGMTENKKDENDGEPKLKDETDLECGGKVGKKGKEDASKNSSFTTVEGETNGQKETEDLQDKEEKGKENFAASAPELSNSEREELEAYRLKEKFSLVDSYKDDFDADTISSFKEIAKDISYNELEAKLAIKFREVSKTIIKSEAQVFSFNNVVVNQTPKTQSYADLVRATLNK